MRIKKSILGLIAFGFTSLTAHADGLALGNADLEARIAVLESVVIQLQAQIDGNATAITATGNALQAQIDGNATAITSTGNALQAQIDGNATAITATEDTLQYVSVIDGELNGVAGPHFIIEGANVHVRSGAGSTSEQCRGQDFACPRRTGLGNLIIGYNEPRQPWIDVIYNGEYVAQQTNGAHASTATLCAADPAFRDIDGLPLCDRREGSHGLIMGRWNNNMGHANIVAGLTNDVGGHFVSVIGGQQNSATANYSVVSGGLLNRAYGFGSSVSGGYYNMTGLGIDSGLGRYASVSGGAFNVGEGESSSVSGGAGNLAAGGTSSISGGEYNRTLNFSSAISGGSYNSAFGERSSITGGAHRSADADDCHLGDNGDDC